MEIVTVRVRGPLFSEEAVLDGVVVGSLDLDFTLSGLIV